MLFIAKVERERLERDLAEISKKKSQWRDIWIRFTRNKLGMVGLVIIVILVILTVFAPFFTKYDPSVQNPTEKFAYPSAEHIMGTDNLGRDLWTRLIYGGRVSLMVSLAATAMAATIGITLGAVAGYFGGIIDLVLTRLLDIIMAIPQLLLAVSIAAALGTGPFNTALSISISSVPGSMRILRSTVLAVRNNDFVEAARATGSGHARIIFKEVLPNTIAPLLVNLTLSIGGCIMAISGLSFIGLGVQPPTAEWGSIMNSARQYIRDFWPIVLFPAIFIFLTVFSVNLLGDGLRDALDPRLKD